MYEITSDNATRFFWLTSREKTLPAKDFEKLIVKGQISFKPFSGRYDADRIGSTLGIYFYSMRFLEYIDHEFHGQFESNPIEFDGQSSTQYFYLCPKTKITEIPNLSALDENDKIEKQLKQKNMSRGDVWMIGTKLFYFPNIKEEKVLLGAKGMGVLLISGIEDSDIARQRFKNLRPERLHNMTVFA